MESSRRTGMIATKLGMSNVFDDSGASIPVTVLKIDNNVVVGHKTQDTDGYNAIIMGFGDKKIQKISKPIKGQYRKHDLTPMRTMREFRISSDAFVDIGSSLAVDHFAPGQFVDVTGTTIGKGFAGSMKRHNFSGGRASHGASISHRAHGSTGQCQDPGKVFKGKKMAGRMGGKKMTVQNICVLYSDKDLGLIVVKGAIPGHKGAYVYIADSVKYSLSGSAIFPASIAKNVKESSQAQSKPDVSSEPETKSSAGKQSKQDQDTNQKNND